MAEENTRVDFNAPQSLVDRADRVAELLDISRTRLLIDALEEQLAEVADDEEFRRRLKDAFYDERIDYGTVESILGTEEAMQLKLLRESLDRQPPEPQLDGALPTDEEFYERDVPSWSPDEGETGTEDG